MSNRKKTRRAKSLIHSLISNMKFNMSYYARKMAKTNFIRKRNYLLINTNLKEISFNYILGARFSKKEAPLLTIKIRNYFQRKKLPFCWWITPEDKPADLDHHLRKEGLKTGVKNKGMYLDLNNWKEAFENRTLLFHKIKTAQEFEDFTKVRSHQYKAFSSYFNRISQVYSVKDKIEFYVGYRGSKPVTRGIITYHANVAGLYYIATKAEKRRRGYGSLMQNHLLHQAKKAGFRYVVLHSTQKGLPLYKKVGFQECCTIAQFQFDPLKKHKAVVASISAATGKRSSSKT